MNGVTIDTRELQRLSDVLRQVLPEVRGQKGFAQNPVRTAVRKMAKVAEESVKAAAPVDTGNLKQSITSKIGSTGTRDRALVKGNSAESYYVGAKSGRNAGNDGYYLPWVEQGTARSPGHPFMVKALKASQNQAQAAFVESLGKDLDRIVAKLARQI